ncbi:MAG: hypothetical protein IKU89_01950, partial [Oscillospiraceae bacterium]|nr:hypothetical protein [Oscillospiraceae bacterium]
MKKILAILLTMVMLFTTLAFPLPVSAESVRPTGSIHTSLVKYAGNDDVTYDPATGAFQTGAVNYWEDIGACLRLNPADGVTYSLEGLESITIELTSTPWTSSVLFNFYTQNNETDPTKDPQGCEITTDPAEVKLYGNHTYTKTITVNIVSIPEGATELKQIKIRAGANFTNSIKSITLNYAEGSEEPEEPEEPEQPENPTPVEGSILGNLTLIGGTSNASWDESTYTATFGGQYQRVHLGLKEGVTIPLANLVSFDVELEEASTGKTYFTFYTTTSTSSEPTDYKVVTDITG